VKENALKESITIRCSLIPFQNKEEEKGEKRQTE